MENSEKDLELSDFMHCLRQIKLNDTNYVERTQLVYEAIELALELGYEAGIRFDPKEPKWPIAYIELATGQVSWRLPEHKTPYDGHTSEDKYSRIDDFIEAVGWNRKL